jgi:hypothetical protein
VILRVYHGISRFRTQPAMRHHAATFEVPAMSRGKCVPSIVFPGTSHSPKILGSRGALQENCTDENKVLSDCKNSGLYNVPGCRIWPQAKKGQQHPRMQIKSNFASWLKTCTFHDTKSRCRRRKEQSGKEQLHRWAIHNCIQLLVLQWVLLYLSCGVSSYIF